MPQIIPTAEPFFFPGRFMGTRDSIGCLLVHGFTGAPKEMRWMGEYLARQGYSVLGIRLTGHATHPKDMIRSRYTDWIASIEDGYSLLSGASRRIFFIGLSMGSVLSLLMATRLPVEGVVAMSPIYELPNSPLRPFLRQISTFIRYLPKNRKGAPPDKGWFDREGWRHHIAYPANPVRSAVELIKLVNEMRVALPLVKVPVLLIQSRDDDYFVHDSMPRIYERLGTTDKTMVWIEGSGHVMPEDAQRVRVFKAAANFIKRVSARRGRGKAAT